MVDSTKSPQKAEEMGRIAGFIQKNVKILLIATIGLVVISVGVGIYSYTTENKEQEAAEAAQELTEVFQEQWLYTVDDAERASSEFTIKEQALDILDNYPGTFAAQRALVVLGQIAADTQKWEDMITYNTMLADQYTNSYLAPKALLNLASAYEEMEDTQAALSTYQRLVDSYLTLRKDAAVPALFHIARIQDQLGNTQEAVDGYKRIIEEDPQIGWSSLAKTRILYLDPQALN